MEGGHCLADVAAASSPAGAVRHAQRLTLAGANNGLNSIVVELVTANGYFVAGALHNAQGFKRVNGRKAMTRRQRVSLPRAADKRNTKGWLTIQSAVSI